MAENAQSGGVPKCWPSVLKIAAPVGVTSSASMSVGRTGFPFNKAAVAGAGFGIVPCAHWITPVPCGNGET